MKDKHTITVSIKGVSLDAEAEVIESGPCDFYLSYRLRTALNQSDAWKTPLSKFRSPQNALRFFFSSITDARLPLY